MPQIIKVKSCEGNDRKVPQQIPVCGADQLVKPLTTLYSMIYIQNNPPQQWLLRTVYPFSRKARKITMRIFAPYQTFAAQQKF